ncbi:MAG: SulP family inorganic anion transporter [Synechococcaceae cyanobacterium]
MTEGDFSIPSRRLWWTTYRPEWWRGDLVAGLTAAALVLPKAMAFATIAGLPVQVGLYTCLLPMVVYAFSGSSRVLSVSSTTTLAILLSAELASSGAADAGARLATSVTVAVLVGAFLLLASWMRLGFLADFLSESVLIGFKAGIGLVIVVDQLPKLFGLSIAAKGFFPHLLATLRQLPDASPATVILSLLLLLLMVALPRIAPRMPVALVALLAAMAVSALLGLEGLGVATVGTVPAGLPSLQLPRSEWMPALWPGAMGIALMSFTESIAAARAFQGRDDPRPQPDRELFALGLANIAGGLTGCLPAGGGTSQTAVNRQAGARSPLASLVTAALALAVMLVLAPALSVLPQAALAVVVLVVSLDLIRPREFLVIRHVRVNEFRWALIALVGVVLLGTLKGILVAVVVSLLALAQQEMHPPVYAVARKRGTDVFRPVSSEHPDDQTWPGLLLLRLEGRLFFANVQQVRQRMRALVDQHRPRVLVIDGSALIDLEYSALKMLSEAEHTLAGEGIQLWLAGLNPSVLAVVRRSDLARTLGPGRLVANLEVAVEHYGARLSTTPAP